MIFGKKEIMLFTLTEDNPHVHENCECVSCSCFMDPSGVISTFDILENCIKECYNNLYFYYYAQEVVWISSKWRTEKVPEV